MKSPRVTVLMPLYNGEKYVKKAIDSILNQTYKNFELLLIDDCSTDGTMEIVNRIVDDRIRIIHNKQNCGIAYSRNVGLDNALGDYIALMDDDDISVQNRLELQVDFLDSNPNIDVVNGKFGIIDRDDNIIGTNDFVLWNPKYVKAYLNFYDAIGNGSTMFRKKFVRVNNIRYENNCLGMEDYKFWIDCSLKGNISGIQEILFYWRNTIENESSKHLGTEKRKKKYAEIQWYALEKNGFELTKEDKNFLAKMFPENINESKADKKDLEDLFCLFKKMRNQAKLKNKDNVEEITILLKKLFLNKVEGSVIW